MPPFFYGRKPGYRPSGISRQVYRGWQGMSGGAKEPKKDRRRSAGGLFIPAGLFIGMGVGWALGHLVQGMFVGLGVGFLLFGLIILTIRD